MERILIVDDEAGIRSTLAEILADEGYATTVASSLEETRVELQRGFYDLAILDIWLPDGDGLDLLTEMRARPRRDAGDDDVGPRHDRHRGRGAPSWAPTTSSRSRCRLDDVLSRCRTRSTSRGWRARPRGWRARPTPSEIDGRRERGDAAHCEQDRQTAAPSDGPRPHHRRERHRQGAGGARHPRLEPRATSRSSRSTARPSPRS